MGERFLGREEVWGSTPHESTKEKEVSQMKFRLGFVSNSSSTSHIIQWRGTKEDLRKMLLAHRDVFPTEWYEYETTAAQIIDAIMSQVGHVKLDGWNEVAIYFGDHDGPFAGTDIGMVMDYEGRYIRLDGEDIHYRTEQAR